MALPPIPAYAMPAAEELPANKVAWHVDADRAVLLVHDMQEYFLRVFPAKAEPTTTLLSHVQTLTSHARASGVPVVFSAQPGAQTPEERGLLTDFWGPGLPATPEQTRIVEPLTPQPDDILLTKWRYSAFHRTDLAERLRAMDRDQLLICGVYAHIGCLMTACDAFMKDIQPFLVGDAVADFSPADHRMALQYAASRCGATVSTETVLNELTAGKASA